MSPNPRSTHDEEPSNAMLAQMLNQNHAETTRRLDEASDRIGVLEHYLVNPTDPERTLPIRMRDVEDQVASFIKSRKQFSKTAIGLIVSFLTVIATGLGTWAWNKAVESNTEPAPKSDK